MIVRSIFALAALCLLGVGAFPLSVAAQADGDPISLGTYRVLHSHILGEDRVLQVHLPTGYEESTDRYPVVYILHSSPVDLYFARAVNDIYLTRRGEIPPVIVVGIENTDRLKDFLPWSTPDGRGGRADLFLRFMQEDLFDFVEAQYRAGDTRVLVGPQLSAEFVAWAFIESPEDFDAFILENPCGIEWEPNSLCGPVVDAARSPRASGKYLSIVESAEPGDEVFGYLLDIKRGLEEGVHEGLRWRVDIKDGPGYFFNSFGMREALEDFFRTSR